MEKKRKTQPSVEPLSVSEAKTWIPGGDDSWLSAVIPMVREVIEQWTGRILAPCSWEIVFDRAEIAPVMRMPIRPLSLVTGVTVYQPDGTAVSIDPVPQHRISSEYVLHWANVDDLMKHDPAHTHGLVITGTFGYADSSEIPGIIRIAMREVLAYWHQNRGEGFSLTGGVRESGIGSATTPPPVPVWVRQRLADVVHIC